MKMDSSSTRKYPQFLKVFLPDHCSEKLRIPDAFLSHLSHTIPKKVVLRNRLGKLWPVEVVETENGHLFLQEGWSKVVSDNSLQVGEFIVFTYNGLHIFNIITLGTNGCEKEQLRPSVRTTSPARQGEQLLPLKDAEEEEENEANDKDNVQKFGKKDSVNQGGSSTAKHKITGGRGVNYSVSGYRAEKLEKRIEEFLPSMNPYFLTKMRKDRTGELTIPHDLREDFRLKFSDSIDLQDPEGRVWNAKVVSRKDGRVWITNGWKQLCRWNKVSEDDTLICEFMPTRKQTCQVIRVQIIRP